MTQATERASRFGQRRLTPEWMDDPTLDPELHRAALSGLSRIHRLSSAVAGIAGVLASEARSAGRPLRVLDVACGGGDVAVALQRRMDRAGLPTSIDGCDLSGVALARARELAQRCHVRCQFFQHDAVADDPPAGYDAVVSTLFLHHLERRDAWALLTRLRAAVPLLIVNDLVRSRAAWWFTWVGTRLITRCPVVHVDGPRSVEAAFTRDELVGVFEEAGFAEVVVRRSWPMRMLVVARRPVVSVVSSGPPQSTASSEPLAEAAA